MKEWPEAQVLEKRQDRISRLDLGRAYVPEMATPLFLELLEHWSFQVRRRQARRVRSHYPRNLRRLYQSAGLLSPSFDFLMLDCLVCRTENAQIILSLYYQPAYCSNKFTRRATDNHAATVHFASGSQIYIHNFSWTVLATNWLLCSISVIQTALALITTE